MLALLSCKRSGRSIGAEIAALYGTDLVAISGEALEHRLVRLLDPEVVFVPEAAEAQQPLRHAGVEKVVRLFTAAGIDWHSCEYLVEEIAEEDDQILVTGRIVAEPRSRRQRASFRFAHVWTVHEGRVAEIAAYRSPGEAHRACRREQEAERASA